MSDISNIKDFKNKKKYTKVIEDIDNILKVFSLTQKSLSFFKQYIAVQELVSIIETQKTLLEMQRKKYNEALENITQKHTK
jgi:hypothetical protein